MLAQAAYTVSTAGAHEVVVLAGGRPVPGSPFRAEVSPGQVSAGACQLSGPGLSAIQLGRDMRLFVALADAFGNAVTEASAVETADVKVPDLAGLTAETDWSNTLVTSPVPLPGSWE